MRNSDDMQRLAELRQRIARLRSDQRRVSVEEVYSLVEETIIELAKHATPELAKRVEKRGVWTIESLDDAVDRVCDWLGGSSLILDVWDSVWEAKIGQEVDILRVLNELEKLITKAERKLSKRR